MMHHWGNPQFRNLISEPGGNIQLLNPREDTNSCLLTNRVVLNTPLLVQKMVVKCTNTLQLFD